MSKDPKVGVSYASQRGNSRFATREKKKKDLQQGVHLTSSKVSKEENMAGVR